MEQIKQTFVKAREQNRAALVPYITAGYPTAKETPDILLRLESSGADMIEVGIPFSHPNADGPVIQEANAIALSNGVTVTRVLEMVREARRRGLRVPILLMGYYNPVLHYGERRLVKDAKQAGVNGFIIADRAPEEASPFRTLCASYRLSYVPLVTPAMSGSRMKFICSTADSFIYAVSRVGVTGASKSLNPNLPEYLDQVYNYACNTPIAVGFGISTREHFLSVQDMAEGCIIGSRIVSIAGAAPAGKAAEDVGQYLSEFSGWGVGEGDEMNHSTCSQCI